MSFECLSPLLTFTVFYTSLYPPNFLLVIRVIIKIESNLCYPRIYEIFEQEWGKKNRFFWILNTGILLFQKKSNFQIHQFWTFFNQNFRNMSSFYLPKDHFLKFWWKNVQNWWIWKIDFFWNNKIPLLKIQKD